jgi:phosphoribosylformylglycinamidine synthase
VYLIEAALGEKELRTISERLLADPVAESAAVGASRVEAGVAGDRGASVARGDGPGSAVGAARDSRPGGCGGAGFDGQRYDLLGATGAEADQIARRLLANPVVHAIHAEPFHPEHLPRGKPYAFKLTHVPLRELGDEALVKLSRDAHLFLSLEEMKAIQAEYKRVGREPTDIELETLAQTWSEHCVHKTLKSKIRYSGTLENDPIRWEGRPGHTVDPRPGGANVTIDNLLKSTGGRGDV